MECGWGWDESDGEMWHLINKIRSIHSYISKCFIISICAAAATIMLHAAAAYNKC